MLIAVSGCKKETKETVASKNANEQILKFKSIEDFDINVSTVLKMTPEERILWAKEKGFESFGVKCDEIYSNSYPETITTIEGFNKLVANNSEFLFLEKMDNGEFSLETVLSKCPFRYFANLERMYQIDDLIYKVLEKGTISTTSKNIDKLKLINDQNYDLVYGKDPDLIFNDNINKQAISTQTKSTNAMFTCGNYDTDYQSSGNDRTYMYIWAYPENYTNAQNVLCSRNVLHYKVVPKHRSGIVWIVCTRTISLYINAKVGHTIPGQVPYIYEYSYDTFNASIPSWYTNNAEDYLKGSGCVGGWYDYDYGFNWYHCWGDTPSSPTVNLDCSY